MMTLMEASDRYFQWWQAAATRYLEVFKEQPLFLKGSGEFLEQSLQFKKMADQAMDEMLHQFRLPSREDVTRLHERLNLMESRLVEIQERDWAKEVATGILQQGNVISRDDLKPLQKALKEMEKRMAGASELDPIKGAMAQVEAKLVSMADEVERLKKMMVQFGPKLDALSAPSRKRGGKITKGVSGGTD